ncbi:hypothetical protein [Tolypothrix sp. NIES-4075]|uniref:hypothetical protein n=1 Tax=Tolypothrix sp. NIES-4075 TaxID=2005459 RepID=UPI0013568197|nr:hypothetical protein [Tolypothrix sp. NIES-4075]
MHSGQAIALYRVTMRSHRVLPNLIRARILRVPLRLPLRPSAFKFQTSIPHDFTQSCTY